MGLEIFLNHKWGNDGLPEIHTQSPIRKQSGVSALQGPWSLPWPEAEILARSLCWGTEVYVGVGGRSQQSVKLIGNLKQTQVTFQSSPASTSRYWPADLWINPVPLPPSLTITVSRWLCESPRASVISPLWVGLPRSFSPLPTYSAPLWFELQFLTGRSCPKPTVLTMRSALPGCERQPAAPPSL